MHSVIRFITISLFCGALIQGAKIREPEFGSYVNPNSKIFDNCVSDTEVLKNNNTKIK